ncbi:MAG: dCTP deaminase [Alphaproteobacteria bacterium]|nr:dCTP deaminase [Alphaproteobacteria bacterium]
MTPGTHLRAELHRLGLDQGVVASETDVSRQTINNIVNDRQPISRSMAAKLGRVTGQSSDYWLRSSFPEGSSPDGPRSGGPQHAPRIGFNTVLVNHQIIAAVRDQIIGIDPFTKKNVQRASIDLTLDDFIIAADGRRIDISEDQNFPLQCGQTVNVKTREWVEFPLDYIGRVGPMARLAKYGIITSHGLQVDPGFKGYLQFCLFNAGGSTFVLRSREPIISLEVIPLSSLPHVDPAASNPFDAGDHRNDVASHFQGSTDTGLGNRLIREFINRQVRTSSNADLFAARIPQLDIEMREQFEQAAIASAVTAALEGLRALRNNPNLRTPQSERYDAFMDELAEQLLFSREECHAALAALGLSFQDTDQAIVGLRDGKSVLLHLPKKAARITFQNLALQLQERPDDLLLMLTGQVAYSTATGDPRKKTILN